MKKSERILRKITRLQKSRDKFYRTHTDEEIEIEAIKYQSEAEKLYDLYREARKEESPELQENMSEYELMWLMRKKSQQNSNKVIEV